MQGTLELRLGKETLVAASERGERVYESIKRFSDFLDSTRTPSEHCYRAWFGRTADDLLPGHKPDYVGPPEREVIIDVRRRLLIYDGDDETKWKLAAEPIRSLWSKHGFATYRSTGT